MEPYAIFLAVITFGAAIVNGALGYGFSSLTVPLALLFLANRVLNPALVPIEVALNAYVLWVNRDALPNVWRRMLPIVIGLLPGVLLGTTIVTQVSPAWLKLGTYFVLLPLILLQAAGFRRPIRSERSIGFLFGGGVGVLYSVTTISGPPLAVMLSNQGFTKRDFRASLGFIRLAESSFTAVAYGYAGLFTHESMALIPMILPSIAIGVPIGAYLIQHIRPETFRRVCMSFDAWVVAFGISTLLREVRFVDGWAAFSVLLAVIVIDAWMLYRFFHIHAPRIAAEEAHATALRAAEARVFASASTFAVSVQKPAIE
ncbi:MAG: sulfite exporter TauE/SafE family protein [Acidimicrobiia bacterium]|nr:sulfite exporter TauE/SafE family protein [Acidimicrobiia bacterium]